MSKATPEQRFWRYVDRSDEDACWLWLGGPSDQTEYGQFFWAGRTGKAHRFAYELFAGAIPDGLQLDHLCRNVRCVNPAHLEPVTSRENTLRGEGRTAVNARRTHCKRGHELTEENTMWRKRGERMERRCRTCNYADRDRFLAKNPGYWADLYQRQKAAGTR